ncbi:MAG TPA: hypothetical protein VG227_08615 [Caulobacteraceae bacterium]|jgi:hypothetical protein|nr:hypothetical protein [Caulobacteraceae bacterium]
MQPGAHGGAQLSGLILTVLIAIVVLAMRNRRPRRLRLEAMWVRPVIFLALIILAFGATVTPTDAPSLTALVLAFLFGVAAGWMRGSLMKIDVHPETHDITSRASPAGMLFIFAVLGVRIFIRSSAMKTSVAGVSAAVIADALILFAAAMMITQSVEMFLRARHLLGQAKAASVDPGNRPIVS